MLNPDWMLVEVEPRPEVRNLGPGNTVKLCVAQRGSPGSFERIWVWILSRNGPDFIGEILHRPGLIGHGLKKSEPIAFTVRNVVEIL